jgi:PIN domain nuclease of toxin-antitoxin system
VRLLLDTHVLLWAHAEPERLGDVRDLLLDPANDLFVSAASAWEIAIKVGLGRLSLPEPPGTWVPSRTAALGATSVPVSQTHALGVADLPPVHRDPFDRLLVVQAGSLAASLVSADAVFTRYAVELVTI